MDRNEVEARLAAAETRRREAQSRLEQNAERLVQLEDERSRLLGDSEIAKRGVADIDDYVERLRDELAAVALVEARGKLDDALQARDASLARGAEAAEALLAACDRLNAARTRAEEAHRELRRIDVEAPELLPAEPSMYDDQWRALAPLVEAELGVRLDTELIVAAIKNPNSQVIDELPQHLRELARERKRALQRELIRRRHDHTER